MALEILGLVIANKKIKRIFFINKYIEVIGTAKLQTVSPNNQIFI